MSERATRSAEEEPVQRYVNDDTGMCWAQGCPSPATHLLTTRAKPNETFPQGLLVEAGYCWNDAIWFAGSVVALQGGTFIALAEHLFPPVSQSPDGCGMTRLRTLLLASLPLSAFTFIAVYAVGMARGG